MGEEPFLLGVICPKRRAVLASGRCYWGAGQIGSRKRSATAGITDAGECF